MACSRCAPREQCGAVMAELYACKRERGLNPTACYPPTGYDGGCDLIERKLKRCYVSPTHSTRPRFNSHSTTPTDGSRPRPPTRASR